MRSKRQVNILLIEDNSGDIWLTREAFKQSNKNTNLEVVTDGVEAYNYLKKKDPYQDKPLPDLILLDLNLPKWDGRDVLEKVKTDEDLKHIPIIILTTSNAKKDVINCYKLYANCFITKPVDYESFFLIIQQIEGFWIDTVILPTSI
ncbi:MAG: response regulator [Saprospiraceae bacterium]|nr:response regulator [Saprospiraceae bacterium]MCB9322728.1 response regulator [Lewinellaceae bacterium]